MALSRAHNEALKRTDPLSAEVAKTKAALEKARKDSDAYARECIKQKEIADQNTKAALEKQALQQVHESVVLANSRLNTQVANLTTEKTALQAANDSLAVIVKDSQQVTEAVTEDLIRTRLECIKAGIITASELGLVAQTRTLDGKARIVAKVKLGTRQLMNENCIELVKELSNANHSRLTEDNFLALIKSCKAAERLAKAKPPVSFDGRLCLAKPEDFPDEDDLKRSVVRIEDRPDVVAVRCDSWMASMLSHMTSSLETEELFDNVDSQASLMTKNGIPGKGSLYREYPR